ncbi:MAG: flagellar hook-basal body complex protein FliE [Planctomycetota bacterium]
MNESLPIQPVRPSLPTDAVGKGAERAPSGASFSEVLKKSILEVNTLQQEANQAVQELQTGKRESVTEVLTAVEKADLAFRALMQVRTKLLDAYDEVNRLRV